MMGGVLPCDPRVGEGVERGQRDAVLSRAPGFRADMLPLFLMG